MEGDFISQALEKVEQIDAADLVVGILANLDQESVATLHERCEHFMEICES
ncbi:MAG: hypothetical protein WB762_30970 [Candidatus Sulfotelmatobacter sp.]